MIDHVSFLDIIRRDEPQAFQNALNKLDAAEKKQLLLTPLSEETRENALSYIAGDRYSTSHDWRAPFLTTALDEIQKLDVAGAERLRVLTSANELGQTVFHKALKYPGNKALFSILEDRLRKWSSNEYADAFIQRLLDEPLGTIDPKVSAALKGIQHSTLPYESEDHRRLASLAKDNYQPATAKGLRSTLDKLRPRLEKWVKDATPAYDHIGPDMQKVVDMIKAFNANANPFKEEPFKLDGKDNSNQPKPPQNAKKTGPWTRLIQKSRKRRPGYRK